MSFPAELAAAAVRVRRAAAARAGRSAVFALVVGFLAGVLLAAIVVPDHGGTPDTVIGSRVSESPLAGGAPTGDATSDGAQPGTDAEVDGGDVAGGGAGTGEPGAAPATTPGGPAAPTGAPAGPQRGVSEERVKIGVALLDLGAVRQLGPAFDNGDREGHFRAIVDGWRRRGLLPVHGRDVELVFREYGVLAQEEQRAACVGLVQDERVFAVVADSRFHLAGAECVAREFRTPLMLHDSPSEPVFARTHPMLFSVQMSEDRLLRNLVHWADGRGMLRGKRIGIYYEDQPPIRDQMNRTVKAALRQLGHDLAAEVSTDQPLGGPTDAVAVQQFRGNDVDVALLFTSKAGFMQQAEAQRYRPQYLESDYASGTTNTATSTYPADHFDGTFGITGLRYGEWKASMHPPPAASECVGDFERASGTRVDAHEREAEYIALNKACDAARLLLEGLRRAGRELTAAGLVAAVEGLTDIPMGIAPPVGFSRDRHHGVTSQRTVQWAAACRCWRAQGSFGPLAAP